MGTQPKHTIGLPMLALRGIVLFPHMVLHFDVGRPKSVLALNKALAEDQLIYLTAQKDIREDDPDSDGLYEVGVVAEVKQILKMPGDNLRVIVEGLYRAKTVDILSEDPFLIADIQPLPMEELPAAYAATVEALMRGIKEEFEEYCVLSPKIPKEMVLNVLSSGDGNHLCEYIAGNLPLDLEKKQQILEECNLRKRLGRMLAILRHENTILSLEREIYEKVKDQVDQNQRDYYLREQLKVIQNELGEGEGYLSEADEYRYRIMALSLEDKTEEHLLAEADRLSKMPGSSQEAAVIRTYLDTCLALPWHEHTKDKTDVERARKILEHDHYGMKKVKERILELIAVRKLAPDIKGQIVCLYGPPGVGKTSVAKSIARAMGRKYVRVSLGGMRDESDIRGHRKTYVGSMPGRIISAMKQAEVKNPVILLDEIDKLGHDFRGDPASALLEVLDYEQNVQFRDHYIEVPFDLSEVLFITTANDTSSIPAPLYDRMEIIELSSYTREEKFQIAKRHLIKKQRERHGMNGRTLVIRNDAIYALIDFYTRESGVRSLEREIASLCRKAAARLVEEHAPNRIVIDRPVVEEMLGPHRFKPDVLSQKDEIGVANGLAWTSVGGEMLEIEVAVLEGSGKLELTGSLGSVMKESAQAAITYVRSRSEQLPVDREFYKNKDIHIHAPEGAIPKDGPSAGITMTTALVSALCGIPIRHDVAMTGEVTLRGRVLPIGGLKEKTMAAYRAGIRTVIIPEANRPDLAEIDPVVREDITFVTAESMDTVLNTALLTSLDLGTHDPESRKFVIESPGRPVTDQSPVAVN